MTPSSSTQVHLSRERAPFEPGLVAEARLGSMQEFKYALGWTPIRRSGNQFYMTHSPSFAWTRWLSAEVALRKSVYFISRTGEPREPMAMCKRLDRILDDAHVAVGGILGAKHWFPGLDITGNGRFELVINANPSIDLSFLKKLDPVLERVDEEPLNPALVVHFLTRHEPYFQDKDEGFLWADPVVCLTDLQAAGFDHQTEDLLQHLLTLREIT